ncbi:MAG: hypothetical protein CMD02_00475 [Flavobacteriales bacterium]|nr:hypothetical protein [Flavobacteriales bacterium]|tara:strand:- start:88 stop:522 length:435 start_codon:yes stop_codon:yes gene_type:complete
MTAQIKEILLYKGNKVGIATEPLAPYLKNRKDIKFSFRSTACWRGYFGTWELRNKKLFIISLKACTDEYRNYEVDLNYLFPNNKEVFADWFSGDIRIPQGKMLKYVHMGYQSIFEKDTMLKFKNGILIGERVIDNIDQMNLKSQ